MSTFSTIVAQGCDARCFLGTTAGGVLRGVLAAIGVVIVIAAIVKAVGAFATGKIGGAVKTIIFSTVLAAFMFQPELLVSLVEVISNAVKALLGSSGEIINGGSNNGTPPPPP
jgi:hypothetical protein